MTPTTPPPATLESLTAICRRAAGGDLEARVLGLDGDSELARLGHAINAMLDTADAFVREASAAMECCSHDEFHRPILLRGLKGAYRHGAAVINRAGAKLRDNGEEIAFVERLASSNLTSVQDVADACGALAETTDRISADAADTARATEDIGRQVERIQSTASEVTTIIQRIGDAIQRIDSGAGSIATAVASQVRATSDIGRSIGDVQQNATQVADRIQNARAAKRSARRSAAA